ncbi:MAG: L-threonylcarbamoyladenylate synthase, partial [Microcystaceae cyanobacterium]
MATVIELHPQTPQQRSVEQICDALRKGAIMLYPTDTVYAIGCDLNSKSALQRVKQLKQLSNDKPLTFLCESLSNIADYAYVTDEAYRIMKRLIPGPYTFILPGTKLVPKLVMSPKRKTTGIRVPDHAVSQAILQQLGNPIISSSAHFEEDTISASTIGLEKFQLFDALDKLVDVIVDSDEDPGFKVSTILDMSSAP